MERRALTGSGPEVESNSLAQAYFSPPRVSPLAQLPRVPDVARCEPVITFTPGCLRMRLIVDIHVKVVAKRKAEAIAENVVVTGHVGREDGFTRPTGASVG